MFIADLSTIVKTWKQPECPLTEEERKKRGACLLSRQWCPTLCDPMDYGAHQTPPSMQFPREEHWSGLPFPSPGDLPNTRIKPASPAWQADSLPLSHLESPKKCSTYIQ